MTLDPSQWGTNTKKGMIKQLADSGMSKRESFNRLRPLVEAQIPPMIFKGNVPGMKRQPKSMGEQLIELKNEIGRTYSILGRSESAAFDSPEVTPSESTGSQSSASASTATATEPTDTDSPTDTDTDSTDLDEIPESLLSEGEFHAIDESGDEEDALTMEDVTPIKPVRAKAKAATSNAMDEFARRMKVCRDFLTEREFTDPIDDLGIRPEATAAKLIPAGVPVDALIDVMTMTWPLDARQSVGVTEKFDWESFSRRLGEENQIDMDGKHVMFPYILLLAELRIPIWLGGPMGTGKSTLARQIANHLFPIDDSGDSAMVTMDKLGNVTKQVNYGETALSAGATRGDLLGRLTASDQIPFILSKFCEIYSNGGVFCFEEIDAALPDVLITLNNALAGDYMFNSANGEDYTKSLDFISIATANTWGNGANMLYLRERLDAATLDRFRMGRVLVKFDQRLADLALYGKHSN
jgi:AAA domain (dynein-related subfamily)